MLEGRRSVCEKGESSVICEGEVSKVFSAGGDDQGVGEAYLVLVGRVGAEQPATVLVVVGLQPPVISRRGAGATAKDLPEAVWLVALFDFHQLAHQGEVHAD